MGITNLDTLEVATAVKVAGVTVLAGQQAAQANAAAATATAIAAAAPAAAAAATSTAIAAATPAAAPAGGTGAAAGGWDTAANRDAAIATINGLRDICVEVKTDHDALLADVADIRNKYAVAVTHAVEMDLDYEALLVDVNALRTTVNALLAKLRTHGIIAT